MPIHKTAPMAHAAELVKDRAVVTGAAGFIGSRLALSLLKSGLRVLAVDELDHAGTWKKRTCVAEFLNDKNVDWLHWRELPDFLRAVPAMLSKPRAIYHLGASSSTTEMRADFLREVNVDCSRTLWDYAVKAKVPFVYASSAATYGAGEQGYSDDPAKIPALKPLNPYGQSKQDFDLWVLAEQKASRTPPRWAGLKYFNVYGPGEAHKGSQASVVLAAFQQFKASGKVKLFRSHNPQYKDGEQLRDFVYVDDCVAVTRFFAEDAHARSGIYNVGTGKARSFLDLARATAAAMDVPCEVEWVDTPVALRERYQYFTQAELTNLRAAGYAAPFATLEDGVRAYVAQLS